MPRNIYVNTCVLQSFNMERRCIKKMETILHQSCCPLYKWNPAGTTRYLNASKPEMVFWISFQVSDVICICSAYRVPLAHGSLKRGGRELERGVGGVVRYTTFKGEGKENYSCIEGSQAMPARPPRLGAHLSSKTALSRNVERPLEYTIRYKKGSQ
jgi:hypothetical protein